jgi:hypothetical protein
LSSHDFRAPYVPCLDDREAHKKTQELNVALLKIIENDGSIQRLSEQLETKPFSLTLISPFLGNGGDMFVDSESRAEL